MIFEAYEFMRFVVASWRWWGVLVPAVALMVDTPARVATSHLSSVLPKELPQLKPRSWASLVIFLPVMGIRS
jgi:hypothetical protein